MTELIERYAIGNFIDTYALGHYARVYEAQDLVSSQWVALKIMRAEHLSDDGQPNWEAEAFINEADLLLALSDNETVMDFYDCGYIQTTDNYPADGGIRSFGRDLDAFRQAFYPSIGEGWRPYLALEFLPRQHNLLYVMKSSGGRRLRLPTEEGIHLALQFGKLLYHAHEKNIVFMDHKLEHAYWDGETLRVIDWNSSKRVGMAGQPAEPQKVNDIHNLCVGILYPIFTGAPPQKGDLRPQPGSIAEVEARYEGINQLDFSIEPTLSRALMNLLESGAKKQIGSATALLGELQRIGNRFGWSFAGQPALPDLDDARQKTQIGLQKLRASHDLAREARDALLEAATLGDINEDMEQELRRLMSAIGDYLNQRVIP